MSKIELKIWQLEQDAAGFDAAYRHLRRDQSGGWFTARKCEALANLLRSAADARQQANELRAQLPAEHPLYRQPPWQPAQFRARYAA